MTMTPKLKCAAFLAGAAISLSAAGPAFAADGDGWQFSTAPFLWGSGIDGDYTIGANTVDVNLGFDDLFDATEFGFQTYLELRKAKFGFYANPSYIKFSGDADSRAGHVEFDQDFWMVEAGGFYNLVQTQGAKPFTLDVLAGARYWNIDTDFTIEGALGVENDFGATFEVIDPIVGVRLRQYLTERLSLAFRGDVGGFGISEGDTSEFSWQALALVGYDINDRFTAFAGYRALGIDAEEDGGEFQREIDLVMHGAVLGVQITW